MTFKSIAEFLAPKNKHNPTSAERKLIAATQAGEPCKLFDPERKPARPTGPDEKVTIRANLLRLLILGGTKECGLHERGVWLEGGWIEGRLDLSFCIGKGQTVLDHCHFVDRPAFTQTKLPQLSLENSALPGFFAQGVEVVGSLFLSQLVATGTVNVNSASVGGGLSCIGATLDGGKDNDGAAQRALNAQGVTVAGDLFLRQLTATGTVDVAGASIGGQLDCAGAKLDGGKDKQGAALRALNAQRMSVTQGFFFREIVAVTGPVDLTAAHVGDLVDDAASWPDTPDGLILDGFTYDQISGTGPTTFAARRKWLLTGSHWDGDLRPQPYTQFAKVLRQMGHASEARKVLIERERLLVEHRLASDRKDIRAAFAGGLKKKIVALWLWRRMKLAQLWFGLTRRVAGYGYAPQYALYWALYFIGVSFFAYMGFWCRGVMVPTDAVILTSWEWLMAYISSSDTPALIWAESSGPATSHYETFYSLPYALDVFLPIVDLGQQSTWGQTTVTTMGKVARVYTWGLQIAGYVITSLGLAAATGIIQRNQPD